MRPLVSVITPLYNYEEYVGYTVKSVLQQTYQSFEHIIVDDGSTDRSANVVKSFLSDHRIKLIELPENRGHSHARNVAIEASVGEFITTIDSDDMLTPESLRIRVQFLLDHAEYDVVHGRSYVCYGLGDFTQAENELSEEAWHPRRLQEHIQNQSPPEAYWDAVHAQGVLSRRSVFERVGLYDEEMRWKADRELWHRMLQYGCRLGYVDAFVAIHRRHDRNISQSEERLKSNIDEIFISKCKERSGSVLPGNIKRLTPLLKPDEVRAPAG